MMRRRILVLAFLFIALVSFATAETADMEEEDFEHIHENLDTEELKEEVNQNRDDIPDFVSRVVGDQRINVYFQETGANYSAVMDGTEIVQLEEEELDQPTLEAHVNESSVDAVLDSENSMEELKEQLDEGGIEYEAKTRTNQVRMFITQRAVDIFSRFNVL